MSTDAGVRSARIAVVPVCVNTECRKSLVEHAVALAYAGTAAFAADAVNVAVAVFASMAGSVISAKNATATAFVSTSDIGTGARIAVAEPFAGTGAFVAIAKNVTATVSASTSGKGDDVWSVVVASIEEFIALSDKKRICVSVDWNYTRRSQNTNIRSTRLSQ